MMTLTREATTPASTIAPIEKSSTAFKMGYDLMDLSKDYQFHVTQIGNPDSFVAANPLMQTHNGQVLIEVTANELSIDAFNVLQAQLAELGFEATGTYGRVISGFLPIDNLDEMARLSALNVARPAYKPVTHVGAVTSQADQSVNAETARETFDVDGSGVTVGVLSDSFNNLGGAATDIATGDLPRFINVIDDLDGGGIDEGRAMLQLIHDIAPGANLSFTTAFTGQAGFAQGIQNLADQGADIIVDDVIYLNEPFYQDGIVAQAVNEAVDSGAAYFSAAGNSGNLAYEQAFQGSDQVLDFGSFQVEAHDFDPGAAVDIFQSVTIPVGGQVSLAFQWDSPFFSVSGGSGSPNDLDIFLLDSTNSLVLASSADPNIGNDPAEVLSFTNRGEFGTDFNIAIGKFDGPDADLMKYVGFGNLTINEYDTTSSTLFGHANARGAEAVGAASFLDTPAFGTSPPEVEPFSALGTTPILFDEEGDRLVEPDVRSKPEIVAPDGTNTTFFGQDIPDDPDSFPNFFGTSAAAPHAAAVAALLKEVAPELSPNDIYRLLQETALDMDDPSTPEFDVGFDFATGFGLIQVDQALERLFDSFEEDGDPDAAPDEPDDPPIDPKIPSPEPDPPVTQPERPPIVDRDPLQGTSADDVIRGTDEDDLIRGRGGDDRLIGKRGDDRLWGQVGQDRIIGKRGGDTLWGGLGQDLLRGNAGRDVLRGGSGPDLLFGGRSRDILRGGRGRDMLMGDQGRDILTGGRGRDSFALTSQGQSDIIRDFEDGRDRLWLGSRLSFSDLQISGRGNNTIISAGNRRIATLINVDSDFITQTDIIP